MESQFQLTMNGQAVTRGDLNLMGETAALADDRILAELLRMDPYASSTISRGILSNSPLFKDASTSHTMYVNPFRAIIGSRTDTTALLNWRDIRSAVFAGSNVDLAANSSGHSRWDLVYAKVSLAVPSSPMSVKVKDTSTGQVTTQSLATQLTSSVTVLVVTGTPGTTPAKPALPSDDLTNHYYYIPLAYVMVFNGYTTSALDGYQTWEIAPCLSLSPNTGTTSLAPANEQYKVGGTVDTNQPWNASAAWQKPPAYLPSTMVGKVERLIVLDFLNNPASHVAHDIVDDSIDWNNRLFKWIAYASGTTPVFAWEKSATTNVVPSIAGTPLVGMGQSFVDDATAPCVFSVSNSTLPGISSGSASITIYCEGHKLKVVTSGSPSGRVFIWLEATGQYLRAATVPSGS